MKCVSCRNDIMTDSFTSYFAQTSAGYVIIEHVPCKKCVQCGEEVFSATVMERIDEILSHITSFSNRVCIMKYEPAA